MNSTQIVHMCVGELVAAREQITVSTVLGSCVSVCLFAKNEAGGGMIHYALPRPDGPISPDEELRYASIAIPCLIEKLKELTGKSASDFVAKIVGGAASDLSEPTSKVATGSVNIKAAKQILAQYGIKIVGESIGGNCARKILFHIPSGRLQVARTQPAKKPATTPQEKSQPQPQAQSQPQPLIQSKGLEKRRVLIVDDSRTIRELLQRILSSDPELEVVGTAADPIEANQLLKKLKPDVITLDIHMPKMTGVEWLERLMPTNPLPVVMISSLRLEEGNEVFRALELGAVDYIQKPSLSELGDVGPIIREKIKEASFAKIIRRKPLPQKTNSSSKAMDLKTVLAIGASTGGTEALKDILCSLPAVIPPTVVVQHIPPVFSRAFADRLNQLCPFEVKEAEDGDILQPSRVLIAPGGKQMKVERTRQGDCCVRITDDPPVNRHKPSVDYLFNSVSSVIGKKSMGIILTGMGNDGAKGLLAMRNKGCYTIGQDEETSVVYGMPRVAFEMGAVERVASLWDIPKLIVDYLNEQRVA